MNSENIGFALQAMARKQPDVTAIIELLKFDGTRFKHRRFSYGELEELCNSLACGLYDRGLKRGDKVALLVPAGATLYALTFALYRIGAVVVFIDPGIGIRRMGRCLDEAAPDYFVGVLKAQVARIVCGWAKHSLKGSILVGPRWLAPKGSLDYVARKGREQRDREFSLTKGEDDAAILFTSGSTGAPKGVVYSHRTFSQQIELLRSMYQIEPGEVDLPTFPLFGLFDPALGMTTVVPDMNPTKPAKADPVRLIAAVKQFGVTNFFGSPALLATLTRHTHSKGMVLSSVKRVLSAGAPVGREIIKRVREILDGDADLHTPYGATECLPVATISGSELLTEYVLARHREGGGVCVGRPLTANSVQIIEVSDEPIESFDEARILADGEIGEIIVLGPTTSQRYHERPLDNQKGKIWCDEKQRYYHRMGDLGYLDRLGNLWFCGRKAHRIPRAEGFWCAVPIEQVLNEEPEIFRSALVEGKDQKVAAVVELMPKQTFTQELENRLRRRCKEVFPNLSIDGFWVHPSFPVDIRHNAKIDRPRLSKWVKERSK